MLSVPLVARMLRAKREQQSLASTSYKKSPLPPDERSGLWEGELDLMSLGHRIKTPQSQPRIGVVDVSCGVRKLWRQLTVGFGANQ